jgi:AraC family transcriptional regulator, regulatory protein of adaptative response / methylated-DNA-[protein]-cysteine methyltransferase
MCLSDTSTVASVTIEAAWNALLKKDRNYDGKFVYVAVTTRIYCRPSCPARNPQPRNTLIFLRAAEAEKQGYVACVRCRPNSLTAAERSIEAALDYIETHLDETLTLNAISQVSALSPHHLGETFKHIVGLSPKAFCDARRFERFKQFVRAGQSIVNACYEAGFGSSRALYERATKRMGMTPAAYKRGGEGVHIRYAIADSGLGRVLTGVTKHGICTILLGDDDEHLIHELQEEFPNAILRLETSAKLRGAVRSCQSGDPLLPKLSRSLRRRIFQAKVWNALTTASIPLSGTTRPAVIPVATD